ncbi:MAG: cation:proton antiporter [Candidatus Binatia bacterium]
MLLLDVVVLLGVAVAGLLLAGFFGNPLTERIFGRRIGIPPIVVYLVAGVVSGPGLLGLVKHSESIDALAEIGVALLLFGVGIEFSLDKLRRMVAFLVVGGAIQVVASVAITAAVLLAIGRPGPEAIVAGFLVSLSSTALVFKMLEGRGELDAPAGQAVAGVLLFQDLALVPMMLLLPALAGPIDSVLSTAATALLRAVVALAGIVALARFVLPRSLELTARARLPELFPSVALLAAFGTALAAASLGLSLPLGAFLAGLALSGTTYAHQVFAELLPLRDSFVALFFTSIGALVEPAVLFGNPELIAVLVGAVILKGLVSGVVVGVGWRSARLGVLGGCALAQIGEFSFVLSRQAGDLGILSPSLEQAFLGAAVLTMAATPFVYFGGRRLTLMQSATRVRGAGFSSHVVVVGYDATGQAVARVLGSTSIPFVVLDMDPARVRAGVAEGLPVLFGDGSRRGTLEGANIESARAVVVAVSDALASRRITSLARQLNAKACILVRAHGVEEIAELERFGATEVIPAEFEASIEIFVRLLQRLGVPRHVARVQEGIIRLGNYHSLRGARSTYESMSDIERLIGGGIIESAEVMKGSEAEGRTLAELDFRSRTGAVVLTMIRDEKPVSNPDDALLLQAGDRIVVYGPHAAIASAIEMFDPRPE